MEKFCGGESFWNTSLTWGDDKTYPGFTECFQNSVIIWIPSGWLWLSLPFYLPYLFSQKSCALPNSWKNLSKLCIALLQLVIIVVELLYGSAELNRKNESYFQAYFIGPLIEALTLILVVCYMELERRKGLITSGVLFMYWLLANFTYIIPFYRKIIEKGYEDLLLDFVLFNVYFFLSLIQLILNCIAETLPIQPGKRPCPETRASFFSRITYQWIQELVVTGYRKPLTEDDMFALNPSEQSKTVVNEFESHWRQQEIKIKQKLTKRRNLHAHVHLGGSTNREDCEISESTPLLGPQSSKSHDRSRDRSCDDGKRPRVSLPIVLVKTFGWDLLVSNIWKLIYDILVFVNPFLLQLLIDFAVDSSKPTWKGYVYSAAFFLVISVQSFTFHFLMHQTMTIGIRLRSALISAVFKKSLRMNNQARTESTVGEIVNLMSVDAEHIKDLSGYLWGVWSSPLQIIGSVVYLYYTVGYAMFAGLAVMILLVPFNMVILTNAQKCEKLVMERKDDRIKLMTEILNGIKILKLYAWEMAFGKKVTDIRSKELAVLLKGQILYSLSIFSWTVAPFAVGLATFATYIYTQDDHKFDPQAAFVAMTLFNILRFALNIAPIMFMELIKASVSIKRMGKFLNNEDLDFTNVSHDPSDSAIKVEDGTFSWDPEIGPCLKDITMKVPKGSLVAVVGTVGAGKSSLMSAILGEMQKINGKVNVDGSTAYVPQQAWIQNATVKDNIIFGQQVESKKYKKIIDACALKSDLDILQGGDMTEIGEKGINLSGGQKQRISLARAVYFDSDIYLLDDPLSAVDSHVGKHIFDEVIGKQGLLKQKTRVLVTHGIHWLPKVDMIFVISNGVISELGSYDELLSHDGAFAKFLRTYLIEHEEEVEEEDEEAQNIKKVILQRLVSIQSDSDAENLENILVKRSARISESEKGHKDDHSKSYKGQVSVMSDKESVTDNSKLIEEEELEVGNVNVSVFMSYAKAVGYKSCLAVVILYGIYQALSVWSSVWLTDWTSDDKLQNLTYWPANSTERRHKNDYYLGIYGAFGVGQALLVISYALVQAIRCVRASKILHENMLTNVLRGPMWFFDTTPVGRIVNRFSQDIEAIDSTLPHMFVEVLYSFYLVFSILIIISYSTPIFLSVIIPVGVVYIMLQRFYIPTSRQLKRLESKTRSPIYNNFSESLTGASVIRAFKVQDRFIQESEHRVDYNQEYSFASNTVNRWLGFRLEEMGAVIVLAASMFSVLERNNINGALVGLSVSYALQITENLNWLVRMVSEFETNIVSVERVGQYTTNPTEAALHTSEPPRKEWPDRGHVQLESYSTRYREGLSLVLKNINININPGEKVGIVGRTGAGKSSLTLSLFRLIEASSGRILVDGQDVSHLGLYDLRSRLTILPQEPVLFSGSLRMNLDPLGEHDDSAIWTTLEHAHLKPFVDGLPTKLEYEVGEGGQNLSVGQRQLMCLARSLLRKSKILVLDEATAAVDLETDALIQNTINTEFTDCTVLTIAHRLNTVIDYDRILVLGDGELQEFDSPQTLLQNTSSAFYAMAKDAGLV
ncbi:multidrug resistance-associated protein 1-like [Ruditapes philippinarum]|uniref:multidrug resistance-associated protein 1-like n=1 Tax=Ruditapes philippinarum TaxID=129788 RepID=UPI00295BBF86|nr:multidrug resistance-associated protein 1-like [Ruditapes philippinarum]